MKSLKNALLDLLALIPISVMLGVLVLVIFAAVIYGVLMLLK